MLTLGSGILPSTQVTAAVAHVRRLKRNQRKGKLIRSLWVFCAILSEILARLSWLHSIKFLATFLSIYYQTTSLQNPGTGHRDEIGKGTHDLCGAELLRPLN